VKPEIRPAIISLPGELLNDAFVYVLPVLHREKWDRPNLNRGHGHPRPEGYQATLRSRTPQYPGGTPKRFVREATTVFASRRLGAAMATMLEFVLVALVLAALFGAYRVIRAVKPFVVNAVVGLVVILLAQALGAAVAVTPLALLVVAIAGFPGALLVILLAYAGVAFAPAVATLPLVVPL